MGDRNGPEYAVTKKKKDQLKQSITTLIDEKSRNNFEHVHEIWRQNYYPTNNIKGLSIISDKDRAVFTKWLAELSSEFYVQMHVKYECESSLKNWCFENNIPAEVTSRSGSYNSTVSMRGRKILAPQIFIKHVQETETSVSLMPAFHLAMYLATVREKAYNAARFV